MIDYGNTLSYIQHMSCVIVDRVQEGIRELEQLKDKRDVNLGATMALMLAHKKSKMVGKLPYQKLQNEKRNDLILNFKLVMN